MHAVPCSVTLRGTHTENLDDSGADENLLGGKGLRMVSAHRECTPPAFQFSVMPPDLRPSP